MYNVVDIIPYIHIQISSASLSNTDIDTVLLSSSFHINAVSNIHVDDSPVYSLKVAIISDPISQDMFCCKTIDKCTPSQHQQLKKLNAQTQSSHDIPSTYPSLITWHTHPLTHPWSQSSSTHTISLLSLHFDIFICCRSFVSRIRAHLLLLISPHMHQFYSFGSFHEPIHTLLSHFTNQYTYCWAICTHTYT